MGRGLGAPCQVQPGGDAPAGGSGQRQLHHPLRHQERRASPQGGHEPQVQRYRLESHGGKTVIYGAHPPSLTLLPTVFAKTVGFRQEEKYRHFSLVPLHTLLNTPLINIFSRGI